MDWKHNLPEEPGIYLARHFQIPQLVIGMNLKKMKDGTLMRVNSSTVTPGTKDYDPMPGSCLTYATIDSLTDFEFLGPLNGNICK